MIEWRAVFEYPPSLLGPARREAGPWRDTEQQARADLPWRPDESHGRVVGFERREVGPPEPVG